MSEERQNYEAQDCEKATDGADARWPAVQVAITGPVDSAAVGAFAALIAHVLGDGSAIRSNPREGVWLVNGYVDGPIEDFVGQIAERDVEIRGLRISLEDANADRLTAERSAIAEARVATMLEQQLVRARCQKLALAVANGDLPPENFEARRKLEAENVRALIASLRVDVRGVRDTAQRGRGAQG